MSSRRMPPQAVQLVGLTLLLLSSTSASTLCENSGEIDVNWVAAQVTVVIGLAILALAIAYRSFSNSRTLRVLGSGPMSQDLFPVEAGVPLRMWSSYVIVLLYYVAWLVFVAVITASVGEYFVIQIALIPIGLNGLCDVYLVFGIVRPLVVGIVKVPKSLAYIRGCVRRAYISCLFALFILIFTFASMFPYAMVTFCPASTKDDLREFRDIPTYILILSIWVVAVIAVHLLFLVKLGNWAQAISAQSEQIDGDEKQSAV